MRDRRDVKDKYTPACALWVRESGLWSPLSAGAFQFVASICRLRRLGTREGRARHVSDVREVVRPREAKCTYLRARGRRPVVPVKLLCTPDACTSPPHHNPLTTHISLQRWCRGAQPNCANRTTLVRPPRPCRMLQPRPPSATQPARGDGQKPTTRTVRGERGGDVVRRAPQSQHVRHHQRVGRHLRRCSHTPNTYPSVIHMSFSRRAAASDATRGT